MARVYVGTYRAYANGSLFGKWLDLEDYADHEDFIEACKEIHAEELKQYGDVELMFQDCDGVPQDFYSESNIESRVWDWLELSEHEQEMYGAYVEVVGRGIDDFDDVQDLVSTANDNFIGRGASRGDIAEQYLDDTGQLEGIPSTLRYHIDFESYARDWAYESCFGEYEGESWAFHPH